MTCTDSVMLEQEAKKFAKTLQNVSPVKKDVEDFRRGYEDEMAMYRKSAYERGREAARRDIQREEMLKAFGNYNLFVERHYGRDRI